MRHGPERAFLCGALPIAALDRNRMSELAASGLDWDLMVERARRSAVLPTLAFSVGALDLLDAAPARARELMRAAARQYAVQNGILLSDLAEVVRALGEVGIPSIALKGSALLAVYYPSAAARHTDDIDLLVRPEDARRAGDVLLARGFVSAHVSLLPDPDGAMPTREPAHLPPIVSPRGTPIEIHWRIPCQTANGSIQWDDLVGRAGTVTIRRTPVLVPSPADLFSHLCIHTIRQHRELRLLPRHIADLHAVLATGSPDAHELAALASASNTATPTRVSLALLRATEATSNHPTVRDAAAEVLFPCDGLLAIEAQAKHLLRLADFSLHAARRGPIGIAAAARYTRAHLARHAGDEPNSPPGMLASLRRLAWTPIASALRPSE